MAFDINPSTDLGIGRQGHFSTIGCGSPVRHFSPRAALLGTVVAVPLMFERALQTGPGDMALEVLS
jgi:hypothetical protein